jgi:predicted transcriptional regulator
MCGCFAAQAQNHQLRTINAVQLIRRPNRSLVMRTIVSLIAINKRSKKQTSG